MMENDDYPQTKVLTPRGSNALIRVHLAAPFVLESVDPPQCGTCPAFNAGHCREHGRPAALGESCTKHDWERDFRALSGLLEDLRRQPGAAWPIQRLSTEFLQADERDEAYLAAAERGERPPVRLVAGQAIERAPLIVNSAHVSHLGYVNAEAGTRPERVPALKF